MALQVKLFASSLTISVQYLEATVKGLNQSCPLINKCTPWHMYPPPDHPLSNNHKINDLRNKKGGLLIWSVRNQARPPGKWAHMVGRQSQCHKVALWPCMCTLTCVCAVVHIHTHIINTCNRKIRGASRMKTRWTAVCCHHSECTPV